MAASVSRTSKPYQSKEEPMMDCKRILELAFPLLEGKPHQSLGIPSQREFRNPGQENGPSLILQHTRCGFGFGAAIQIAKFKAQILDPTYPYKDRAVCPRPQDEPSAAPSFLLHRRGPAVAMWPPKLRRASAYTEHALQKAGFSFQCARKMLSYIPRC